MIFFRRSRVNRFFFTYRYDLLAFLLILLIIVWYYFPLWEKGLIIFSDLDFPLDSSRYLEEIFDLWNPRWNTGTMLNLPRLIYVLPSWLLSQFFESRGDIFQKALIFQILITSAISMYLFTKRIVSVTLGRDFDFFKTLALIGGSLFYTINPWIITRIQHLYLLCGYSLFPLLLLFFFNAFDPRYAAQLIPDYSVFHIRPYKRTLWDLAMGGLVLSVLSAAIHYFFFALLFLGGFSVLMLLKILWDNKGAGRRRKNAIVFSLILKAAILGGFTLIFSFYWFGPYFAGILTGAQASQHNINVVDTLVQFSRHSQLFNVLLLNSYWWPMFDLRSLSLGFYVSGAIMILLVFMGALSWGPRNRLVMFFAVLTAGLLILATGTRFSPVAKLFIPLVMKTPIFGNIFRDPNKLLGLAAVGYSVLITAALESLFASRWLTRAGADLFKVAVVFFFAFALWGYISPYHREYVSRFYAATEPPEEYKRVQESFSSEGKVLHFPLSEEMLQSPSGVATPYWNLLKDPPREKATGDFAVYSSLKNSFFHHEGNPPEIGGYFRFLHRLWDEGLTLRTGELLKPLAVNEMAYRDEYQGHEGRQDFHKDLLSRQIDLRLTDEIGDFSVYSVENPMMGLRELDNEVYTPYGFSQLVTYSSLPDFSLSKSGVMFTDQKTGSDILGHIDKEDSVDARYFEDIWLNNLSPEYYLFPSRMVDRGNVFLGWAQTMSLSSDWSWHLGSQDLGRIADSMDFHQGMVATYASSTIHVPLYHWADLQGDLVMNFNSMLRQNLFFKADNPQLFVVRANPLSRSNKIPTLHGEIVKGTPKAIWQVAKSGLIDARSDNPYQFRVRLSGRGAHNLHVKVRFYDVEHKEMGLTYVMAPGELVDFDEIDFYGEYVTPGGARWMRIDLLSYQREEQAVYWWIHDVEIMDLVDYKEDNSFQVEWNQSALPYATEADVYIRAFSSVKGGILEVASDSQTYSIDTKNQYPQGFHWHKAGRFILEPGMNPIRVINRAGFNGVNALAVIPAADRDATRMPAFSALARARLFTVFEAESDFFQDGHLQTTRCYPVASMGAVVREREGILRRTVDIHRSGYYRLTFQGGGIPEASGLEVMLKNEEGTAVLSRQILWEETHTLTEPADVIAWEPSKPELPYTRSRFPMNNALRNYQQLSISDIPLARGRYTLELRLETQGLSLITPGDLRYFDPSTVLIPDYQVPASMEDCSTCERIRPDMMRFQWEDNDRSLRRIIMDSTCSCDWYVASSQKIPVTPLHEYLIRFDAVSRGILKRHGKVFFLDADGMIIKTEYIREVEEDKKVEWNHYEHLATAPSDAAAMLLQFWARGNKLTDGWLDLRGLDVFPWNDLSYLDWVFLREEARAPFTGEKRKEPDREILVNTEYPLLPMWHWRDGQGSRQGEYAVNGLTLGFFTKEGITEDSTLFIPLSKIYRFGLALFILGILGLVLFGMTPFLKRTKPFRAVRERFVRHLK